MSNYNQYFIRMLLFSLFVEDLEEFSSSVEFHEALRDEVEKPTIGLEARRHLLQQVLCPPS